MMKRKKYLILSIIIIFLLCAGCKSIDQKAYLSDLGGVFSYNDQDLDFKIEISGRLSESEDQTYKDGSIGSKLEASETLPADLSIPSDADELSTKLRAWGISRKPDNRTPDADPGTPDLLGKYGGIYIGDTNKKEIYLTFDEGYENGYTPKILDVLRDNNAKAVFFITGPYLKNHQDLVRRMLEEGHIVGNHTIRHPSLPGLSEKELEEEVLGLDRAFNEKFGKNMKYLRPPKGEYSEKTLAITQKLGYRNMFWSFAYDDWYRDKVRGADYAYNIVMRNLHNGEILLLHAVSKDNAEALESIIKGARAREYEIGNVEDIK